MTTKQSKLNEALSKLEVDDYLDAFEFIENNWGYYTIWKRRSFDVYLCKARKLFPDRAFKLENWLIKRVK